jgi:hypothetical protein
MGLGGLGGLGGGLGGCAHGAGLRCAGMEQSACGHAAVGTLLRARKEQSGWAHAAARTLQRARGSAAARKGQCCCALGARLRRGRGGAAARTWRGGGAHKEHGVGRQRECVSLRTLLSIVTSCAY